MASQDRSNDRRTRFLRVFILVGKLVELIVQTVRARKSV